MHLFLDCIPFSQQAEPCGRRKGPNSESTHLGLFDSHSALAARYEIARASGQMPTGVVMDQLLSASEAIINGRYYWIPFSRLTRVSIEPPTDLRDMVLAKAAVLQGWIDAGRMAPVDPVHLFFTIWAATQTYADFEVQVAAVLGKSELSAKDHARATEHVVTLILRGCGLLNA